MKFSFFSILLVVAYIMSGNKLTLISLFASAIHELGHIIAARVLKIKFSEFRIGALEARLKVSKNMCSYKNEALLCLSGPLANLLCASVVYIIGIKNENILVFAFFSVGLAVLNLLPVRSFDGGRIFEAILNKFLPFEIGSKIIDFTSFMIVFSLWSISVYFLLKYSSSINLFIFSSYLFCSLFVNTD